MSDNLIYMIPVLSIPVLVRFMSTWHKLERPSVEEMPPYDWAVGKLVGHFLN